MVLHRPQLKLISAIIDTPTKLLSFSTRVAESWRLCAVNFFLNFRRKYTSTMRRYHWFWYTHLKTKLKSWNQRTNMNLKWFDILQMFPQEQWVFNWKLQFCALFDIFDALYDFVFVCFGMRRTLWIHFKLINEAESEKKRSRSYDYSS